VAKQIIHTTDKTLTSCLLPFKIFNDIKVILGEIKHSIKL
jgi:hypothetical protein